MADKYIDGSAGSHGSGSAGSPYQYWGAGIGNTDTVHLKRGTSVRFVPSSTPVPAPGFAIRDYGDAAAPKPVLYLQDGDTRWFTSDGSTTDPLGLISLSNFDMETRHATLRVSGFTARKGARVQVTDVEVRKTDAALGWSNGMVLGGQGSVIDRLVVTGATSGTGLLLGDSAGGGLSAIGTLITDSYLQGASDALSFHDGTTVGPGHVVRNSTLVAGSENAFDAVAAASGSGYREILVEDCDLYSHGSYVVSPGNYMAGLRFLRCRFLPTPGDLTCLGIQARGPRFGMDSCVMLMPAAALGAGSVFVQFDNATTACTGARLVNNTFVCLDPAVFNRSAFRDITAASSGVFANNLVVHLGTPSGAGLVEMVNVGNWLFRNNAYYTPHVALPFRNAGGAWIDWAAWKALAGTPDAVGSLFGADPLLDASGRPPVGSPLFGAGFRFGSRWDKDGRRRPAVPAIGAYDLPAMRAAAATARGVA